MRLWSQSALLRRQRVPGESPHRDVAAAAPWPEQSHQLQLRWKEVKRPGPLEQGFRTARSVDPRARASTNAAPSPCRAAPRSAARSARAPISPALQQSARAVECVRPDLERDTSQPRRRSGEELLASSGSSASACTVDGRCHVRAAFEQRTGTARAPNLAEHPQQPRSTSPRRSRGRSRRLRNSRAGIAARITENAAASCRVAVSVASARRLSRRGSRRPRVALDHVETSQTARAFCRTTPGADRVARTGPRTHRRTSASREHELVRITSPTADSSQPRKGTVPFARGSLVGETPQVVRKLIQYGTRARGKQ